MSRSLGQRRIRAGEGTGRTANGVDPVIDEVEERPERLAQLEHGFLGDRLGAGLSDHIQTLRQEKIQNDENTLRSDGQNRRARIFFMQTFSMFPG